jgi:hypothetical protein
VCILLPRVRTSKSLSANSSKQLRLNLENYQNKLLPYMLPKISIGRVRQGPMQFKVRQEQWSNNYEGIRWFRYHLGVIQMLLVYQFSVYARPSLRFWIY